MERRNTPRIPLDTPCLLTLSINYDESAVQAMAVDVSPGGVQLALPPNLSENTLTPGMPTTFKNVPAPLDALLEGVHGKIAWTGQHCCGIRLNKSLDISVSDVADIARI